MEISEEKSKEFIRKTNLMIAHFEQGLEISNWLMQQLQPANKVRSKKPGLSDAAKANMLAKRHKRLKIVQ